ncbi:uncharacterized protein LOC62_05G006857 [Vanrija pseudolonga]|uniref:DUF6699 domain-containing protein n=1 Tax=Vanrija pseudolonga TaxID=143232 RepID=A0AAF0YED0_9TREE|nr:hypothetical protein LOC62_05G006857 [Vanrija pseudolonga]
MLPARTGHESNPASPFKASRPGYGPVINHTQATQLDLPLRIHPLLNSQSWVEELQLGHVESGWSIRVRNRKGVTCEDVLYAIYDFFASPLYVDEMSEMLEQQYFEKRRMGYFDLEEGYRKSDSLLGATYFDGLHNDAESLERLRRKYNFSASNLLLLRLGNC